MIQEGRNNQTWATLWDLKKHSFQLRHQAIVVVDKVPTKGTEWLKDLFDVYQGIYV